MPHSENSKDNETFTNLSDAFDFTAEDLDANRRGIITPRQRARLRGMGRGISGCSSQGLVLMVLFALIVGGFIILMNLSNESMRRLFLNDPAQLAMLLGSVPLVIVVFLGVNRVTQKSASQLSDAKLLVAEGKAIIKREYSSHGGTGYVVNVGAKKFNFLEEYSTLFKQGAPYRVYYAQAGPYEPILSIEQVE